MCKVIPKVGVAIDEDDIDDCCYVGNQGQNIIKFAKRMVLRQVLNVVKDIHKVKRPTLT